MKNKSGKYGFAALLLSGSVASAFAFDANTLAFYPFTDGDAGVSAVGQTIRNGASGSYAGTGSVNGSTYGSVSFSADTPAKYIFSGKGGAPIATNVQSLAFNGTMTRSQVGTDGGNVAFEDLGTALSACDEYTVEFFWKACEDETPGLTNLLKQYAFKACVSFADGSHTATGSSEGLINVNLPENMMTGRLWVGGGNNDVNTLKESFLYDTYTGYKTDNLADGKWHHFAITHSKTKSLTRIISDYTSMVCPTCRNGVNSGLTVVNETLTGSHPFNLGNFAYHGKIAGLRVTQRILDASELLYASNDERFYTDLGDTLCHWRCEEGTNGEPVAKLVNAAEPVDFQEANPDLFFFNDTWIASTYKGEGVTDVNAVYGSALPVYTNELPSVKRTNVCDGDDRAKVIGVNENAVALMPPTFSANKSFMVKLPSDGYRYFTSGSFTVEGFYRFDINKFKEMGASTAEYVGSKFMEAATPNTDLGCDWQFRFDMQPKNPVKEDWQYMRLFVGGYAMKDGSPSFKELSLGSFDASFKLLKGDWVHLAVVYEDQAPYRMKVYLDYELFGTLELGAQLRFAATNRAYTFGQTAPFLVDEMRISRRALAPEEMLHLNRPISGMLIMVR